jgi:predicted amidohydrolase
MLSYQGKFKAAAVQSEPVWMNIDASIDKAISLIEEAARNGASLIGFPEGHLPGYPWFVWLDHMKWQTKFLVPFHENCLELGDHRMRRLQVAARRNNIAIVMGYAERVGGSRYLAQVFIAETGEIVANRRKVKPTAAERLLFGEGTGSDYLTQDFAVGRVGGLNCWEHFHPLVKYMMYSLGEQIHVASWPAMFAFGQQIVQNSVEVNACVTRSYAIEGQCFVLCSTDVIGKNAWEAYCDTDEQRENLPLGGGWARIWGPDGAELAKPLAEDEEGILYAEMDLSEILIAKRGIDVVGHTARPDLLSLSFDARHQTPVRYVASEGRADAPVRSRVDVQRVAEQQRYSLEAPSLQIESKTMSSPVALAAPRVA